jgi:hypothetical protein
MKWIIIALSFFAKRFMGGGGESISPVDQFKEFVRENALKVFIGFIAAVALGTLFSTGIVLSVMNLAAQYDLGLAPRFTATVAGGLSMVLVSVIITAIIVYAVTPGEGKSRSHSKRKTQQSPLGKNVEDAVMLLVNDFIKEREAKRETQAFYREQAERQHAQELKRQREEFVDESKEFNRH